MKVYASEPNWHILDGKRVYLVAASLYLVADLIFSNLFGLIWSFSVFKLLQINVSRFELATRKHKSPYITARPERPTLVFEHSFKNLSPP